MDCWKKETREGEAVKKALRNAARRQEALPSVPGCNRMGLHHLSSHLTLITLRTNATPKRCAAYLSIILGCNRAGLHHLSSHKTPIFVTKTTTHNPYQQNRPNDTLSNQKKNKRSATRCMTYLPIISGFKGTGLHHLSSHQTPIFV